MPKKKTVGKFWRKLTAMPKKKKILLLLVILVLVALAVCIGWTRFSAAALNTYQIGKDTVTALPLEDGGKLVDKQSQDGGEDGADAGDTYTYAELPDAGASAGNYVALLTTEGEGFFVVNQAGFQTDPPDFQQEAGQVTLSAPSAEEGKQCRLDLHWAQDQCVVALSQSEKQEAASAEPVTMRGAVEYLQNIPPAALGLEGNTMASYIIYPKMGTVYVDGAACMELDVYADSPVSTNAIIGSYFLAGDNSLYKLDRQTRTATKLEGLEGVGGGAAE